MYSRFKLANVLSEGARPATQRSILFSFETDVAGVFSLSSILHRNEWPHEGRFLDLHTFGRALRDKSYGLKSACKEFQVEGKMPDYTPSGRVTTQEIDYCRQDVKATANLLNAMKEEFDQHPVQLRPDRAFSPASIAKAYAAAMGITLPKNKFAVADQKLGIAMQSYYGGRAECRIRKTPVPVVHTDFTSQYPTGNALLDNFGVLTAESVSLEDCSNEVCRMLGRTKLDDTFKPNFWKKLSFFALVVPEEDVFPVRTVYNGRTQNIGLNYLSSKQPIWFAGPDVIASCLLANKVPTIVKAIRMIPHGRQSGLRAVKLRNTVNVDPLLNDFFCHVIEQKAIHKRTNKPLSHFLKILANSGSYGLLALSRNSTRGPFHAAFLKTTNSVLVTDMRCALSRR